MPLMPRHKAKRLFRRDLPVYARRELTEGDRTFAVGDEVPWQKLGWPEASVLTLFRLRQVSHAQLVDTAPDGVSPDAEPATNERGERLDGPTIEEWVAHGYLPEHYPPSGWAIKPSAGLNAWRAFLAGDGQRIDLPWDDAALDARRAELAQLVPTTEPTQAQEGAQEQGTEPAPAQPEPTASETVVEPPATQVEPQPEPEPAPAPAPPPAPERPAPERKKRR